MASQAIIFSDRVSLAGLPTMNPFFTPQPFPLFIFISFISSVTFFWFNNMKYYSSSIEQLVKTYLPLGNLIEFVNNRHRFLDWTTEILSSSPTNTATLWRPGDAQIVLTVNPLNIEHMSKTNFDNYHKGSRFIFHLQDLLGAGIFNCDGDLWKLQRKTASLEFNTKSLRDFIVDNVSDELHSRLIPLFNKASENQQVIDLQHVLECFGLDSLCKLAFSKDTGFLAVDGDGDDNNELLRAFEDSPMLIFGRFLHAVPLLWRVKRWFNVGSEKQLRKSIKTVHEFLDRIIESRLKEPYSKAETDLLSRFIARGHNSPEFLRDCVISFIFAGRDSSSSALSWFFWILSSRPDVERNILDEMKTIRNRSGKHIGDTYDMDELREMNYLHAAITETMRLYPPVPIDSRECLEDDVMPDGTFLRKGWFATYHTYAMGRMESVWGKDCREFVPERWLENGTFRAESAFRYPIFHAGPRMCLGKDMAYTQMKSIVATVMEQFEVEVLKKDTCPEIIFSLSLRMKAGLKVRVKRRR